MIWSKISISKGGKNPKKNKSKWKTLEALTATINRASLKTKLHIVSHWSLISARSGSQWIEADPILWPTQHWTAGVMASLWHNQKKEEKKERLQKARFFRESFLFLHPPPPANIVIDVLVSVEALKKTTSMTRPGHHLCSALAAA